MEIQDTEIATSPAETISRLAGGVIVEAEGSDPGPQGAIQLLADGIAFTLLASMKDPTDRDQRERVLATVTGWIESSLTECAVRMEEMANLN